MKHSNIYLGLVLPSGGWQSLIAKHAEDQVYNGDNARKSNNSKIKFGDGTSRKII